jgi:hypothetical protein
MQALADGGIARTDRERVLQGLPPEYSDAVAAAQCATADRD